MEVRVRNFKFKVRIENQTLDMYLLQGSVLVSTQDQICLDCVSWARVHDMQVLRKQEKNTFEIRASKCGGQFWRNNVLPSVVVLESDSLAGSLEEEVQKLQRDSKNWSATNMNFISKSSKVSSSPPHTSMWVLVFDVFSLSCSLFFSIFWVL